MYQFFIFYFMVFIRGFCLVKGTCDCESNVTLSVINPQHEIVSCYCRKSTQSIPSYLNSRVNILTVESSKLQTLKFDTFPQYKSSLTDLSLVDFSELWLIEDDAFNDYPRLQSLFITQAPILSTFSLEVFNGTSNKLKTIRIIKTAIRRIPKIKIHKHDTILNMMDFEGNRIEKLTSNSIQVQADYVAFDYNLITKVEDWTFNNSKISKISLKGNRLLRTLSEYAFKGLSNLLMLDVSGTSIMSVPVFGLEEIEVLIIKDTYTLSTIPSIYDFQNLREAHLTYFFHCCAFKLPKRHNPEKYARYQQFITELTDACKASELSGNSEPVQNHFIEGSQRAFINSNTDLENSDEELFHQEPSEIHNKNRTVICGALSVKKHNVQCDPIPDAFNPCEDIMGYEWLRCSVWIIVLTGLLGNICVLVVILSKYKKISVERFLIANLALSDLCMLIYLLLLAIEDLFSKGYYFNFAFHWQRGIGCKIAGFISIFSSQLSIFTLCLLTLERWYSIKKALYVNKFDFRLAIITSILAWIYSIFMASLPILGISGYSNTSLCLPMKTDKISDIIYVSALLLTTIISFVIICVCYGQIYLSLSYETRHKDGEYKIAYKMALLVSTNLICWMPISFFALTALFGYPLINITNSKILLVFFCPINSCANPFLYAILTSSFRKDLLCLLSRFGVCKKSAERYRLIYSPFSKMDQTGHLLHLSNMKNNQVEIIE